MEHHSEHHHPERHHPERHIECSSCKKPIVAHYTEIVGKMIYRIGMCQDCPILKQKLQNLDHPKIAAPGNEADLCCGGCGLTADELRMGAPLGCSLCYEVFEDIILHELEEGSALPRKYIYKKTKPMHMGHRPGEQTVIGPAAKLHALHQALNETLAKEDYEQAAWLRDQIKALTEKKSETEENNNGRNK